MKLKDLFSKKTNQNTEKVIVKIDKKQLEKIVGGGAGGKTTPITIKMGGSGS